MRRTRTASFSLQVSALLSVLLPACRDGGEPGQALELRCGDIPEDPSLIGAPAELLDALSGRLKEPRMFGLRVQQDGCAVEVEVVSKCQLPAKLELVRQPSRSERVLARDLEAIWTHATLGTKGLREHLQDDGIVRIEWAMTERWAVRAAGLPRKGEPLPEACGEATHLVRALEMGRYRIAAGSPKAKRFERVSSYGYSKKCRGSPAVSRDPECEIPLRMELVPLKSLGGQDPVPQASAPSAMVRVAAGTFVRGSKEGPSDERPARQLVLGAFEIDRTEVRTRDYERCVADKKCTAAGAGPRCNAGVLGREDHPINCISWEQAEAYCRSLGKRLPTEAEWERAARGVDARGFEWGEVWPPPAGSGNFSDEAAHLAYPHWSWIEGLDDGFALTAPVDRFGESEGGPVQMGGNVAEWVADWYDPNYYGKAPAKDPPGPARGEARVIRGGTFGNGLKADLRLTRRAFYVPGKQSMYFGVRCARSAEQGGPP